MVGVGAVESSIIREENLDLMYIKRSEERTYYGTYLDVYNE